MEPSQIIDDLTHPSVTKEPESVKNSVSIHSDPYSATKGTHAIVLCTEWDEFMVRRIRVSNCVVLHAESMYESEIMKFL